MTDKSSKKKTLQQYRPELSLKWNFIAEIKSDHHSVKCTICNRDLNIANSGRKAIERHIDSEFHKKNSKSVSGTKKISSFNEDTSLEKGTKQYRDEEFCNILQYLKLLTVS